MRDTYSDPSGGHCDGQRLLSELHYWQQKNIVLPLGFFLSQIELVFWGPSEPQNKPPPCPNSLSFVCEVEIKGGLRSRCSSHDENRNWEADGLVPAKIIHGVPVHMYMCKISVGGRLFHQMTGCVFHRYVEGIQRNCHVAYLLIRVLALLSPQLRKLQPKSRCLFTCAPFIQTCGELFSCPHERSHAVL